MYPDQRLSIIEHLEELRTRIVRSLICLVVVTGVCMAHSRRILAFFLRPLGQAVFTAPAEAFMAHMLVSLLVALFISMPFIAYQCWCFISAGLRDEERRLIRVYGPVSYLLFLAGAWLAYGVVLPLAMTFLLGFRTPDVMPMISVGNYIGFVAMLIFGFGFVFELPLVMVFLTKVGLLTPALLGRYRRYVIVGVFVTAAVLTPPDVISQLCMAVPLLILYELGIIFSKMAYKKPR